MPEASAVPMSVEYQMQLTSDHIDEWLAEDFLQLRWWALIIMFIIGIVVWWKLLDKRRLRETVLFTAIAYIIVLAINEYGQELILWDYPVDVIPIFPPLSSVNLLLLPLVYSVTYQRVPSFGKYSLAVLAVTTVFCFAVEPLLAWGGFFELLNWRYWMSFPVYVMLALLVRLVTVKVIKITARARTVKG